MAEQNSFLAISIFVRHHKSSCTGGWFVHQCRSRIPLLWTGGVCGICIAKIPPVVCIALQPQRYLSVSGNKNRATPFSLYSYYLQHSSFICYEKKCGVSFFGCLYASPICCWFSRADSVWRSALCRPVCLPAGYRLWLADGPWHAKAKP